MYMVCAADVEKVQNHFIIFKSTCRNAYGYMGILSSFFLIYLLRVDN